MNNMIPVQVKCSNSAI